MSKVRKQELAPPYQRLRIRRLEEKEKRDQIADALKRNTEKQDLALKRWANPMPEDKG